MKRFALVSLFCFIFLPFFAQNFDTVHIKSVVVKARLIHNDTSVSIKDIASLQTILPSLSLKNYGRGQISLVSLRGMPARHTKVGIEGLDIAPASSGLVDFSVFPYQLFPKVKISYVLNSGLATGAFGGYLDFSVIPKDNLDNLELATGSFGTYQISRQVSLKTGQLAVGFGTFNLCSKNNFVYQNEFLPGKPLIRMQYADFQHNASMAYVMARTKNRAVLRFWVVENDLFRHFPPPISYNGAVRKEYQGITQFVGGTRFYLPLSKFLRFENLLGVNLYLQNYGLYLDKSLVTKTLSQNSNFQAKTEFLYRNFSIGLNLKSQNYILNAYGKNRYQSYITRIVKEFSGSYVYDKSYDLQIFAGVISVRQKIFSLYSFSLGFRHFIFNFNKNINIPSLDDLYWYPGGNPNLKPEVALASSLDFKYVIGGFGVKSSLYAKRVDNWILWKPTDYHYWTASNIGLVYAIGSEVYISKHLNLPAGRKIKMELSFVYQRVVDSLDRQLIYVPNFRTLATLEADWKFFKIYFKPVYESKRYTIPGNEQFTLKGFFTADMILRTKNFSFKSIKFNFALIIRNLTNSHYYLVLNRPLPGINYLLSLKIRLK